MIMPWQLLPIGCAIIVLWLTFSIAMEVYRDR